MTETQKVDRRRGPRGPRLFTAKTVFRAIGGINSAYGVNIYMVNIVRKSTGLIFDEDAGCMVERESEEDASSNIVLRIGNPKGDNQPFAEGNAKEIMGLLTGFRMGLRYAKSGKVTDPGLSE